MSDNTLEEIVRSEPVAYRYQRNAGRRKCIFLLLLIIFGLILVLIFKPRRRGVPPATSPEVPVSMSRSFRYLAAVVG